MLIMLDFDEESLNNVLNNKMCRICMSKNDKFNSLFECSLLNMIKSCLKIDIKENDGLPTNICRQCIQSISRFHTFQQKSQEVDKILRYNIEKLVVYNIGNAPEIPNALEIAPVQPTTLDYVSHECFSLDAIVDELDLQAETDAFVDELAIIELQEPFAGVIEPSQLVKEGIIPDVLQINNEPVRTNAIEKTNVVHSCMICNKTFSCTIKLKRHIREHKKAKTFICHTCEMGFTDKRFLLKHMVVHDKNREKPHICRICEKTFYDERALSLHSFRHFVSKSIKCKYCDVKFSDKASMKKHTSNIHFGAKNFKCDFCPKRFQFPGRLKDHLRIHNNEKQYECSVCHASFNQNVLAVHMKTHNSKLFECNFCGKKFTFLNNLKIHQKLHTGDRSFLCDQCGKNFVTSVKLRNHKKIHTENRVKTIICSICSKTFFTKPALKKHQLQHSDHNLQLFTCDICLKTFTTQGSMTSHRKRHDPVKSYECSYCQKKFKELGTLKSHERTHSGEKPYKCLFCSKSFSQSSSRNVHVKSIHSSK